MSLKHGGPCDTTQDFVNPSPFTLESGKCNIAQDREADPEKLKRAEWHLDGLLQAAMVELRGKMRKTCTRNIRLVLCMFIDECRLRKEKVQKLIASRELDAMKRQAGTSTFSVIDLGTCSCQELRQFVAGTVELQNILKSVMKVSPVDYTTELAQRSLVECLEQKLILQDTRLELLKAAERKPMDPILPSLRIIKDRWNRLKQFSLYSIYEEEKQKRHPGDDEEFLACLVETSNNRMDAQLELDKDHIISHDSLVPSLCYDLLKENVELRKMTNSYQLHVFMLHEGMHLTSPKHKHTRERGSR